MRRVALLLVVLAVASLDAQTDPVRAVRELGRQERPALATQILPSLSHARVEVRREAANAVGQAFAAVPRLSDAPPPTELATATRALLARLRSEPDAMTRGVVAETLGRLPHRTPAALRQIYATAFEVDARWVVECAARRQKWIDQAQSLNIYMAGASGKKLHDTYLLAWQRGLKTTYYLRTVGATHAEKSTSDRVGQLNAVSSDGNAAGFSYGATTPTSAATAATSAATCSSDIATGRCTAIARA